MKKGNKENLKNNEDIKNDDLYNVYKNNMDYSEAKSIKQIHDYMKECLSKPFNDKNSIELCENDIPSIYSSLKKYILRLTNINNFMRCENYVLKKKNEKLIKNIKESNISYMDKKNMHDIYINKINKLNNENDFIKYKFQKMLRKNISLERNNIELNRNLLNKDNYTHLENNKKRVKHDNEENKIIETYKGYSSSHLYEHTKCDNSIIFNNENYLDNINPFSLEKEIEKIIECTNILQGILNLLNHNLKYEDPIIFAETLKNMNIEKEKLLEHNSYLKNKILQIETFILNDPFLGEKFSNLYDMVNIDFDKSIKKNIKLYEKQNMKILFKRLCSLENKNDDIKDELIYQKKQLDMYKMHIYDIKNIIKKKINNFYTLNYHQNIVFNALNKFNNAKFAFNNLNYFNSCENDEKSIYNSSMIKDKFNCTNNLSTIKNSDSFTIFQINNNKTGHNHKLLNEAWQRISQLGQDVCYFKKKKTEKTWYEGEKDISGEEDDYMANELYYIKIKELINKRKIKLNNFLNSELREIKYTQNDTSKISQCKLGGYKLNNCNLKIDSSKDPNYENNYINSRIILKYMKYKQAYNFYMQNKNLYKKNVNKTKFNDFLNKYILNDECQNPLNYNNDIQIGGVKKTFFELHQKKKIPHKKKSNEQRESMYVEIENIDFGENQIKLSQENNLLISKKSDNSELLCESENVKKDIENETKKNDSLEKNEDNYISLNNLKNNDNNSENFNSCLECPKRHDLSLDILRTNINNLAKKKTIENTNNEHIENGIHKRSNSNMLESYEINKNISSSSINSNQNFNTTKEQLYQNVINREHFQYSIEFESTNESEKLTNIKEESEKSANDLKKEIIIQENKYDSTNEDFNQNLKHQKSSIFVKKKIDCDIEVKKIINQLSIEFYSDELNNSKESEGKENFISIKNILDSPILVKDDQENYPKIPKRVNFSSSTKNDTMDIHEKSITDSNKAIKKMSNNKIDNSENHDNKKGEPSVEQIEKTEIMETNSYENSLQINNFEKRKSSDICNTDEFDLKRSISGYSDPDLFDNKKYSNIKIELFRDIIYKYDKNLYEFFIKLILHSNTDLVGEFKNKIFNAQIASENVLDYIVSNYTKNENRGNNININKNTKIEETEKVIDLLGKNDCKIINEYICNNSTSTSLRTLYHKIHFITKENYKEFKDRLLESGVINLINLFLDEDINHFDKIFSVSFVNFGDTLGISRDTCISHFNNMDKKHKEKGYIYLKHILDYLNIENEIKEEYHKYNFISVKNKNYIYISINENYSNLYEFFNAIIKKNNLYITLNEFVYFFSQDEKLKKYNFRKKDVIELYYSILFYAYYNNKNKKLLNILQSSDNPKNDGINTVANNNVVNKETDDKKELYKKEDENSEYNLHLYKGYFTLSDFNFVIELKDLYSYFEGSECPYTKIKRRIIEIYGTLKNGVLINSEMCNNNDDDDDNLENNDADLKDLGIELNEDSFKIFMKDKYKYMHYSKLSLYRKKADSNKIVQKINKKTFMCLMYNIGIHINYCLILWNNFIQFLEADLLDYKILSAFLNGEINLSNNETEQDINYIKKKIMNNNLEVDEFSRNNKHRLDGTICSHLFKNTQKLYSTHALTFDEIEVLSKVLTNVHPFKYLYKNEKKKFISNLTKHCYKKGHTFESIKKERNVKNNEKVCNKEKKSTENYMDTEIIILLNGILKNTKENNSFINSVNVIEKCNLKFYIAHTNVAIVEINDNIYTEDFVNLVNRKRELSNEFMSIVDNIPIFKNFTYDLKNYISMNIKKCEYKNKQYIIRQHDDPLDFYILKDGEVNIYYNNTDNAINTLSAYSFFGEISIIFNTLRTCNVAVKSDIAICYSISSEYFLSLLNKDIVKEFIIHSQINYNEESLNNAIITYMNNQIQNNSNNIKDINISISRLNMSPNTSVNTSMSNNWKNISRDNISNLTSSTTLSLDNIMLDTEYIDNKKYIRSFYSDLDKILLNNFNTEQKYLIEEIETNLMRVKVFKNILSKMEKKDQFVKNLKYEKCPKGKHLILEGDICEKFYFIKQGVVSIRQFNQYKNTYDEIITFKDNQYFGHQLILSKAPSIFIVVTVCNTELYTIDANLYIQFLSPFIGILNKSKDINQLDILTESINNDAKIQKKDGDFIAKAIHFLKKINIINKLSDDELYNSAKNIQFKFFKKGKVIIKYQDEPDFFYIIKKGIVSVKTDNGGKSISNENSLNVNINMDFDKTNITESQNEEHNMVKSVYLHKYEYFGELSIINNQLRTATCEAYTNCFLLAIDKISFTNYFNKIFSELLQEAEIKYTKNYSLPPWLKTIYGNENNYDNIKSFISINLPKLDSSLSSLSDRSSEEFEFEKDIKKKIKKAKKKEKEIKNKKTNKNRSDKTLEKDKVNTKRQNNNENSNKKKINESTNGISHSKSNSNLLSLSIENVDEKIKEIEKEKDKKLEEMKLKELKVFEQIKLRDEKKVERIMKKKNKKKHKKNDMLKLDDNIEKKTEKINKKKNDNLAKEKFPEVENSQISGKVNLNDGNNPTTRVKVNGLKEAHNENNNIAEKKHILQTKQVEQKEGKNKLAPLNPPKKSSSILKIRTNSSSSTDLDVKDLIQKLTNYIESEYSSIYQFYESIDKFNRGYIKYEDFLNSMNSINITYKIFDKEEKIENVFKHLCNDMNILTPNNFYISVYKHKSIDKYELNLRLCEMYSNSILGFKKNTSLKTVDDAIINYEEFENVCNQIGLIDKDNIQNIWNEINIMNEGNIPLEIILNIINGELGVEESYEIYNNKKSILNQVVNFFQGNNAELIKMSTNVMEYNILTNYEDPVIINKSQHKSYPNECNHIVKQLELDPNFKILTLDQRKYFATLMDRKVSNLGDIITKQNSENAPIILLFEGTANLITYTLFGIETVVREIKNDEIYGSSEVIADSRSDYEVKINSNSAIIWILKREHYNEKIKPMLEERQQNCTHILQVLKNVPILRYLPLEILDNISYSMKIEIHEPNHTIIKEGDYDDKFYIICKGLATVDIPSKFSYNKLIISSLKKADYFGELSLINNTARTANVVLDTTSILFSLVSSEFNRLLSPYFDKFTNRAKANYKKIKIENPLPDTDIQIHNVNQNYPNSLIYNRNRKTKVTIQDSNYLKNIENNLKQNIPKQNEPHKSQNPDNKINT